MRGTTLFYILLMYALVALTLQGRWIYHPQLRSGAYSCCYRNVSPIRFLSMIVTTKACLHQRIINYMMNRYKRQM